MALFIACKLPHGLSIQHQGRTLNINGANADVDPMALGINGAPNDGAQTVMGYGLTQLNDDQAKVYQDWQDRMLYRVKDEKAEEANGKLEEPFPPLVNGSLRSFKNEAEARSELRKADQVNTGFDGIDGDAEAKSSASGTGLIETGTDKTAKR